MLKDTLLKRYRQKLKPDELQHPTIRPYPSTVENFREYIQKKNLMKVQPDNIRDYFYHRKTEKRYSLSFMKQGSKLLPQ